MLKVLILAWLVALGEAPCRAQSDPDDFPLKVAYCLGITESILANFQTLNFQDCKGSGDCLKASAALAEAGPVYQRRADRFRYYLNLKIATGLAPLAVGITLATARGRKDFADGISGANAAIEKEVEARMDECVQVAAGLPF